MRILSLIALAVSGFCVWLFRTDFRPAHASEARVPVLVELFTSEGCSSCPPADAFLQKLDHDQPISGADIVVLSEHVDYWDELGWKDPYSSRLFTDRQAAYGQRFGLRTVYTPQMVVDGASEFVGNDSRLAEKAFSKAVSKAKIGIRFSSVSTEPGFGRATVARRSKKWYMRSPRRVTLQPTLIPSRTLKFEIAVLATVTTGFCAAIRALSRTEFSRFLGSFSPVPVPMFITILSSLGIC